MAQLKSSEALLDVRWRELERMLESQSATDEGEQSRKRQRTDDGAPITEKVVDKELTKKLELVEQKYAHTLDFVQQFRTTILNPHFPQRLQQAIASIESTLHNHELFIAHLVDPVAASKSQPITIPADANVDSSTSNTQLLSPAMIPAIQNLVKQSVEYSTKPLLERIRALEEELKKK
ncbi:hypothetical protein BX666DRAFT_242672 [Dichotomocladium elegans]|nr:hypothetical protein BX666DRAFT_242672 [Dichotomocladium elegans]